MKTVNSLAYSSIFLTSGIFSAYNAAWLVERGFSLSDVTLIQSASLIFNLIVPPVVLRYLSGRSCNSVILPAHCTEPAIPWPCKP